ncbi:BMC domain-containing protein [Jeotgalibaca sp. MA1X17-3]|uniref:BMC domain-containing protein n=1 Tax=Jeotgalibaca sp. MA1X17-3 TaxID=2908211 RepID=UPI001F450C1B|nr:BMC domain-containing protein [Jeotgalibaca sp. MA1X17-3]UJF15320.1 BMC domain-containing protein [Jeotgalibaca sp. MA1X17-3]
MVETERIIQEYVPGKQITVAHVIAKPDSDIYVKLGVVNTKEDAIGIMTITPSEASIIAVDIATKAADIEIGFVDRFSGSVIITGDVSSVIVALEDVLETMEDILGFNRVKMTIS